MKKKKLNLKIDEQDFLNLQEIFPELRDLSLEILHKVDRVVKPKDRQKVVDFVVIPLLRGNISEIEKILKLKKKKK